MSYSVQLANSVSPIRFLMILSSDHITGATGKSPSVTLLKANATTYTPAAGVVSEIGNGVYQLAPSPVDANVLGPVFLHATASGCDPRDDVFTVVNYNPFNVDPISPPTSATFGTVNANTFILDALTEIGAKSQGESLTAPEAQQGLRYLNRMMDAWGADSLTPLVVTRTVFDLVANQQTYTIGEGGDWDIVRPVFVTGAGLILNNSSPAIEIPLGILDDNSFEAVSIKALTNSLPTQFYYNPTFPLASGFLWPIPTDGSNQIALYSKTALTGFASLTTQYAFAPSYTEAILYNLAVRLSVPFGRPLEPNTAEMARSSFGRLKRANSRRLDVRLDLGLTPKWGRGGYNINTDQGA